MSRSITLRRSSGSITPSRAFRIASRLGSIVVRGYQYAPVTWFALVWRNLLRRPARTGFTVAGGGLGVGLIVALLSITNGVHRTADDLVHVGRADFGLFQSDVSDFTRSLLPESLAAKVAADPGVAAVAKVKLLVDDGKLVFGLDRDEFAYRRLVVVDGTRGAVMAG